MIGEKHELKEDGNTLNIFPFFFLYTLFSVYLLPFRFSRFPSFLPLGQSISLSVSLYVLSVFLSFWLFPLIFTICFCLCLRNKDTSIKTDKVLLTNAPLIQTKKPYNNS